MFLIFMLNQIIHDLFKYLLTIFFSINLYNLHWQKSPQLIFVKHTLQATEIKIKSTERYYFKTLVIWTIVKRITYS